MIVLVLWTSYVIWYPVNLGSDVDINIPQGASVKSISKILLYNHILRSQYVFDLYISALGEEKDLKAGHYIIPKTVSMNDVIYILTQGLSKHDDIQVTIPEGKNIWEVDKILADAGLISEGSFALKYYSKEGHLFPDTYRFKKGSNIDDIADRMVANFDSKVGSVSNGSLIIASILEKEAKTEEDMRLVAGIIQKRLLLDMSLEIDATVVYGACARDSAYKKDCDVTFQSPAAEIKIDSPYNTYIRKDLPAGPISNPGLTAIKATLDPQSSDYLYYLSTRDGSEIIYARTSAGHAINRRKYLGL